MLNIKPLIIALLLLTSVTVLARQASAEESHVRLSLIPETTAPAAGMPLFVAVHKEIDRGWHTYWANPGDSGDPMRITWRLPEGFEAGELFWPVPERIPFGPLTNYGYEGKATLIQEILPPATLPQGPVEIGASIEILVCEEICIPEYHELSFTLNDGSAADNSDFINEAFSKTPMVFDWPATYREDSQGQFTLTLALRQPYLLGKNAEQPAFDLLPTEWGLVDNPSATGALIENRAENILLLTLKRPRGDRPLAGLGDLKFVIPFGEGKQRKALEITAQPDPEWQTTLAAGVAPKNMPKNTMAEPAAGDAALLPQIPLFQALLFALLGGLILNLMPCVFPILSMKALGLVRMNEQSPAHARAHGLAYTAGILLCFAVIAALLIALKSAGAQIGWGFQLQNPLVVLLLAYLLFLIGLNLSGFFEIRNSFTNVGAGLGNKEGVTGSFLTGVLATIVATPCTAPFMGAAMGFAMTQPATVSMGVFLALGLGLALPYLVLAFFPALRTLMPRPGKWMVVFRELLAFPMYASAVWLVWVYSQQAGAVSLLYALAGFVGIGFTVWVFRYTPHTVAGKLALRGFALIVLATVLLIAVSESLQGGRGAAPAENAHAGVRAYSPLLYAELLQSADPVFVNMTAAWCITCKVNERVALDTEATRRLFAAHSVRYLKGDWTNQDAAITAYLSRYGRSGVPLYVFYGSPDAATGRRPEPVVLPQLLTPGIVAGLFD